MTITDSSFYLFINDIQAFIIERDSVSPELLDFLKKQSSEFFAKKNKVIELYHLLLIQISIKKATAVAFNFSSIHHTFSNKILAINPAAVPIRAMVFLIFSLKGHVTIRY